MPGSELSSRGTEIKKYLVPALEGCIVLEGKGARGAQPGKLLQCSERWAQKGNSKPCTEAKEERELELGFTRFQRMGKSLPCRKGHSRK